MFYTYRQNNSGGRFKGPLYIIIEATSFDEANKRAVQDTSIYFEGIREGKDCSCCGDRWNEAWEEDGDEVPSIYGTPIEEYKHMYHDGSDSNRVDIYYANGVGKTIRFKDHKVKK